MPAFDAACFDLDGTLVDTESLCNEEGIAALAEMGHDVPLSFFESLAGIHDRERVRRINQYLGSEVIAEAPFLAVWDRRCSRRFAQGVPVKAGAVTLLSRLAEAGLPTALVTSSRHGPAHEKLAGAGLERWFATVVTFDDVQAGKPAPDPYLLAAERLRMAPARCVAFEDSETGARSAHDAGMVVVQIPDLHPASGLWSRCIAPDLMTGAAQVGLIA